ncbi:MAG TPA: GNAT family N-acetyltransferase [Microlunatus sp.]|nr:GNAT family N-acetyltransferase [Microlunatus sp.]
MIADGVTFRDLEPADLSDLEWSGSATHVAHVAVELGRAYAGEIEILIGELPNRRLVALGAVDPTGRADVGVLWMIAVHETLQSLGIGSALIAALEDRARAAGCRTARLSVEHDNPRAQALYRRLGYVPTGSVLESWPVTGGRTYVTVCTVMERPL